MKVRKSVYQKHHIIYGNNGKNKEVVRNVRKGVHQIVGLMKRYNQLSDEEINCIEIEANLKRKFVERKE